MAVRAGLTDIVSAGTVTSSPDIASAIDAISSVGSDIVAKSAVPDEC
jgi:hypothetical protein